MVIDREEELFEALIERYIETGVGLIRDFVPPEMCDGLRANIRHLDAGGKLHTAGIGQHARHVQNTAIRRDRIFWLDRKDNGVYEQTFFGMVERFIDHLNRTCYTGLGGYEFHYALYEPGSFYKRHVDQFRNNEGRAFTFILYLNDDWKEGDGGELRIYSASGTLTIPPLSGQCVFFRSKELEHEVLLSHRPRMSVTGWLKRQSFQSSL